MNIPSSAFAHRIGLMHRFAVLLGAFSLGLATARAQEDAPRYSVTEIPYGTAFSGLPAGGAILQGMNNKRQVVGRYSHPETRPLGPYMRLWVYLPDADYGLAAGFHVISTPGKRVEAVFINDQGLIAGTVSNHEDSNRFLRGFTIKADGTDYAEFNFTGSPDDSEVRGIANGGFVCGLAVPKISPPAERGLRSMACLRNPDTHVHRNPLASPTVNAAAVAQAINSHGNAVVWFHTAEGFFSGISDGPSYTLFTPSPVAEGYLYSLGYGINGKNEVVGQHYSSSSSVTPATFLHLPAPAYGLPAGYHLLPFSGRYGTSGLVEPYLNDHGLIATSRAIWDRGTVYPITDILPPETTGVANMIVKGLDNTGAILAYRNNTGFLMLLPEEMEIITVNDDRDLRDHDPDDGLLDVDPDKEGDQITLRAAIDYANDKPGKQRIVFDIPGGGIPTIQVGLPPEGENVMAQAREWVPSSEWTPPPPDEIWLTYDKSKIISCLKITDPVEIDGSTQPGGMVELSGRELSNELKNSPLTAVNGLEVAAHSCLIRGLVINHFYGVGMILTGGSGNRIVGNRIGTDPSGMIARGNGSKATVSTRLITDAYSAMGNHGEGLLYAGGLVVFTSGNTIGGHTAAERNLISGNGIQFNYQGYEDKFYQWVAFASDLYVSGLSGALGFARGNRIIGNYIGTDVNGQQLVAIEGIFPPPPWGEDRLHSTVRVDGGADEVVIGDGSPGGGNVIAGGIILSGPKNVQVRGNTIGVNPEGTEILSYGSGGIDISGCSEVVIDNNRIETQVDYVYAPFCIGGATNVTLTANKAGLLPTRQIMLMHAVYWQGDVDGLTIGGPSRGQGNVFAQPEADRLEQYYSRAAVLKAGHRTTDDDKEGTEGKVVIVGNEFIPNPNPQARWPAMAMDRGGDGVDRNDQGDLDWVPNYPRLNSATVESLRVRVIGNLEASFAGGTYALDFYAVTQPLSSGHGGLSMVYLGRETLGVTVADLGLAHFDALLSLPDGAPPQWVTATATRMGDSTSEFAKNCFVASAPGADADTDGIPNEQEQQLGDRNGDGTPDAEQDHVASFPAANGEPTTVAASPAAAARPASSGGPRPLSAGQPHLEKVMAETVGTLDAPRGYFYPNGLMTFEVADIAAGATVNIRLILTAGAVVDTLWSLAADGAWRALPDVTLGAGFLTVTLTDGGAGDRDGQANGRIVAALGPAAALPPEPPLELALAPLASGNGVLLSWPAAARPAALEFSPDLSGDSWLTVPSQLGPRLNNDRWEFSWPILPAASPATTPRTGFFRLRGR